MRSFLSLLTGLVVTFASTATEAQDQTSCDECWAVRPYSTRGTVGSLFRWIDGPGGGSPPQPSEPLVTDRPDFTEASSVVGLGVLQIESGYTYTSNNDDGEKSIGRSYPEILFRYGMLANWLELRLAINYGDEVINGLSSIGAEDLYLGFKIGLTPQAGVLPEMAIIPQMNLPTGDRDRTDGEVLAGLNWLYSWSINDDVSTGGSTQFNHAIDDVTAEGYTEWAQSWTVAFSLTERIGGYTEYFGFYPSDADTVSPEHYFNGGLTYLSSDNVQWDIRAGTGLNDAADDYFVGTGVSLRFR